ncbi:uncharacterized protein LOC112342134 [Selaginella moellendorffii]|uniref:uncharacterized protein LOC112342134 n=1 Tax=Selaginella moellendorffii TaxID=88036 RepID=UPI000D1C97CD|nr:uncharacterized protein LOC112342134 [Selaginella moellendorffii]|eukprot:XP_024519228.1 uncharacterized protein LOC112342134 [Selaginella moellendorffii]
MAPRLLTFFILMVVTLGVIEAQCDFCITYGGSTLIANCVNQAGATVRSQIDLNTCVGNNNGQLDCSSGYFQSCAVSSTRAPPSVRRAPASPARASSPLATLTVASETAMATSSVAEKFSYLIK